MFGRSLVGRLVVQRSFITSISRVSLTYPSIPISSTVHLSPEQVQSGYFRQSNNLMYVHMSVRVPFLPRQLLKVVRLLFKMHVCRFQGELSGCSYSHSRTSVGRMIEELHYQFMIARELRDLVGGVVNRCMHASSENMVLT